MEPTNANKFVTWLAIELGDLIGATDGTNRFTASQDLINKTKHILDAFPPNEVTRIRIALREVANTGYIGDFRIPYDVREENDWIEGILATIKGLVD